MFRSIALCSCLVSLANLVCGQALEWKVPPDVPVSLRENLPSGIEDGSMERTIASGLRQFYQNGYLLARTIRIEGDSTGVLVEVDPAQRFKWARLAAGNLPLEIKNRVGFRPGRYEFTPVSRSRLELLFERILRESERNGYPYASVRLDSVTLTGADVEAVIRYESGQQVRYGKVRINDSRFVNPEWLAAYLDLREGAIYDQRQIDRISARMEALDFVKLTRAASLVFNGDRADILLDIEKVPANRADAIIGFLPNEEEDGGLRITGEAELHLDNLFRSGKIFDLHWQRMRPETQFLQLGYFHPNLLRSNLNVSLNFQFLKEDTTFTTRDFGIRLDYRSGRNMFSVLSRFRSARLLDIDPDQESLPESADFNLNDYGLAYVYEDRKTGWLGYRGIRMFADFRIGNKDIRRNAGLPAEVYEGIDDNVLQWEANMAASWGILTGRQSLLYQHLRGGYMDSDLLFRNDLYRLGGFRSIRGFNENQFFAQRFLLYTIEWQLYFDESSHIMAFVDQGFFRSLELSDNPTGAGIGLSLQTGGGLLQLAYAVGRTRDQSFDLRLSKFHFGYKAKF